MKRLLALVPVLFAASVWAQSIPVGKDLTFLGKNAEGFEEYRNRVDEAVLVLIPAGKFQQGEWRSTTTLPAYLIDKYEVTNARFDLFLKATGRPAHRYEDHPELFGGPDLPVTHVTPEQLAAYAVWANLELPSEAQWEKAARSDDGRSYPWGEKHLPPGATSPKPLWDD